MDILSRNSEQYPVSKPVFSVGRGEKGSVIVIALIILTLLSIAGISATNMSVTESYIVRNTAIHKQNLQLAEMAASEGIREILNRDDPPELAVDGSAAEGWMLSKANDPDSRDTSNNDFGLAGYAPGGKVSEAQLVSDSSILDQRGETNTLWYYFVGWEASKGSSLKTTESMWQTGKVVGVYNSAEYGRAAVELGVTKRF